jgi:putative transposase
MDFMSDALANGQKLRVLTVVDQYTRECVALEVGSHFRGQDVAAILTRVGFTRGLPATINVDNGTEFTSRAFDHWAYTNHVQLDFSRPGKPTDNATIESFNASVRRECLSQHYFSTLAETQVVLRTYQDDFNNHRPHSSLGQQTPAQFRAGLGHNVDRVEVSKGVAYWPTVGVKTSRVGVALLADYLWRSQVTPAHGNRSAPFFPTARNACVVPRH